MDTFEQAESRSLSQMAMGVRTAPYLDGLNPEQRLACETLDGPVLMLAGAGTGKTKALTTRIVHLLNTGRARPNEILAVTFTNKAAREMKNRVGSMLGEAVEGMPWMGTFHSLCVKILRRHAELVGDPLGQKVDRPRSELVIEDDEDGPYDRGPVPAPRVVPKDKPVASGAHLRSNFTILDTDDQLRLMKQLIRAENIDDKKWTARHLAGVIDDWKNRALTPDKVPSRDATAFNGKGVQLYAQYQQRLRTLNAVDFGDLILHVVTIFQTHPDILRKYQSWFRYILVDEYQDTNVAQYLWLRLLASEHKNICCVGDDDQSIYGWRGAEVGNILRFEKDFPGAHVVRLEQNYRSTPHILGAASSIIRGNKERLSKELWTAAETGNQVRLIGHWDGEEEARWIGEDIETLANGTSRFAHGRYNVRSTSITQEQERRSKSSFNELKNLNLQEKLGTSNLPDDLKDEIRNKFSLDEIAILVRASHQMRAFEDRFLTIGLPYRVIGGPRFYERMEIRDAMAYFRVAISNEDGLAFERIINTPKRGIGDKAQQLINQTAREHDVSLLEGARILVAAGGLSTKARGALKQLIEGFDRWSAAIEAGKQSHIEIAEIILEESGYTDYWKNDKTVEGPGRLENLKELVKALEGFENLQGFLEHISLIMENEQEENTPKVTIMTLHAAKGLEFPAVFLPGWEDGLFPSQRSMDEAGQKGVEEERRLAYVGITRAEEICTISFATNRRVYGQWQSSMPSRFIDELPAKHVEVLTPPGLHSPAAMSTDMADKAARADAYSSPGWKRMQARNAHYTPSIAPKPKRAIIDAEELPNFAISDRVSHSKYGAGTVIGVEADKLSIVFDSGGAKKILASFVTMQDEVPF